MRANLLAHALLLSILPATGLVLMLSGTAAAADEFDHITVTASGQASIKPDVAEVRATVTGSAAMAADALKKFQDNRRRAVEAIKKLKLENLSVDGGGLSMTSTGANANRMVQILGANQNAGTPGHITVTENLVLRLSAIDRMKEGEPAKAVSSMIDAAKDAGLTLGSSAGMQSELVRFRSTKLEDARTAAVQNAMQSARRKADSLAALSKAKIVRIASSREVTAPPVPTSVTNPLSSWMAMMGMAESGLSADADEAASTVLKPIPVNVTIEVQFAASGGQ
jgi:uncharacterized protein YggE